MRTYRDQWGPTGTHKGVLRSMEPIKVYKDLWLLTKTYVMGPLGMYGDL